MKTTDIYTQLLQTNHDDYFRQNNKQQYEDSMMFETIISEDLKQKISSPGN